MTAKQALTDLLAKGAHTVTVEFCGSGDSGEVEVPTTNIDKLQLTGDEQEAIMDYVSELASDKGDWYNNEGGQGTVTFNLSRGTYDMKIGFNYTEVDEHKYKGKF